jgi:hypothetical protein
VNGRTLQEVATPEWLAERKRALETLDVEYARRNVPAEADDYFLLAILHKARYECTAIAEELRRSSARWLLAHGLQRIGGLPILPDGELPR